MNPVLPSRLNDFFFDLRGFLVLQQAVEAELIDALNRTIDALPPLEFGQWYGNAQRLDYIASGGFELHNCVEAGEPFYVREALNVEDPFALLTRPMNIYS